MKPDKYHEHEALHMSNFLVNTIDQELINNVFIQSNNDCLALAKKAAENLAQLYQLIGAVTMGEE